MRGVSGWKRVAHCPQCREELQAGALVSQPPGIGFVPERAPNLELSISSDTFGHRLHALRCDRCGTVVVPGSVAR
jgi:hypothetical protein